MNGAMDGLRGKERYYLLGAGDGGTDYLYHCLNLLSAATGKGVPLLTIATDTETVNGVMWSWQVSVEPGASLMGMCDDRESMKVYMELLDAAGSIVMHNAKHDMHEQRGIGLNIPWSKVIDTMACAYRLGESQGLKALAGRHCGMRMKSYMETVKPYSREYVDEWITNAVLELPMINEEYVTSKKQEVKTRSKKNPLFTPLSRIANSMSKNPDYDPWKAWSKVTSDINTEVQGVKVKGKKTLDVDKSKILLEWKEWLEDRAGKIPTVGLDKVPKEVATWYACRDSDANLRVFEVLDKMEREFGKNVRC